MYRLCEGCVNELKNAFPKKPFGARKEKSFFENIREAKRIIKGYFGK
jgi:hypothetical protein